MRGFDFLNMGASERAAAVALVVALLWLAAAWALA